MKKSSVLLGVAFTISLATNAYLFNLVMNWQNAWLEQMLATADIEQLYRSSGANVSFDVVKELVGKELGEYKIVSIAESDEHPVATDNTAILVDGVMLYFKDGQYIGSKANLPKGLVHWGIARGRF